MTEGVTEEQLREAFGRIGSVKHINVYKHRTCAFVEFHSPETVTKALSIHKVQLSSGNFVLAEERRFNNQSGRYNNNQGRNQNYNNNNSNTSYERRPNNHRRQGQNTRNNNANTPTTQNTANNGSNANIAKGKTPNNPK